MRSSFDVSVGLITPGGIGIGIHVRCKIHPSCADRNAEAALERQKVAEGLLLKMRGPPNSAIRTLDEDAA
jgi:hypothetical protein